ncbi:MAG: hypothetical protein M3Q56_03950 [Bacteroidota bacterium]|nr:hypothetical protein [Bacteroidota bacterium]
MSENQMNPISWGDIENNDYPLDLDNKWNALHSRLMAARKKERRRWWLILFFGVFVIGIMGSALFIFNQQTKTENEIQRLNMESNPTIAAEQVRTLDSKSLKNDVENSNANMQNEEVKLAAEAGFNTKSSNVKKVIHSKSNKATTVSEILRRKNSKKELSTIESTLAQDLLPLTQVQKEENSDIFAHTLVQPLSFIIPNPLVSLYSRQVTDQNIFISNISKKENKVIPKRIPFWISASVMYGPSFFNLSASQTEYKESIQQREQLEKAVDGYSVDFLIGRKLCGKYRLQSGLQVSMLTTEVIYNYQTAEKRTLVNQTTSIEKYLDGSIRTNIGDIESNVKINHRDIIYNSYFEMAIPILMGIKHNWGTKNSVTIDLGPSMSLFQYHDGNAPTPSQLEPYKSLESFKKNIVGVQARGEIFYQYKIHPSWNLGAGLVYKTDLNSRIHNSENFSQKQQFLGVGFRCVKNLN